MRRGWLVALALIGSAWAADPAKIVYTKSFPGSNPAFVSISVDQSGHLEYREDAADANPQVAQLKPAEVQEAFALADKLERFKRPLESNLKVARMGQKTFRYEDGGAKPQEVTFNYTQDTDGQAMNDWFERVSETQQYYAGLERTMKFDKLGVNKALLQFQAAMERKRIIGAEQFLPLLDRLIKNQTYLHMARERAEQLSAQIRGEQPGATAAAAPK